MEFLGIGYQELLLVLVLLLVVVGPERLPNMAYQIGRAVRQMQRYARAVRDEFSDEFEYIETQYRTVRGEIDTTRSALREDQARFAADLREATPSLKEPVLTPIEPTAASPAAEPAGPPAPTDATPEPQSKGTPPLVF